MNRVANMFGNWGLTTKLIGLFFLFGVAPMAIVGGIAYNASRDLEAGVGIRFQGVAENIADKIDRNLFERYGDVQAFGLNRVAFNRSDWYKTSEETSDIVKAINQYVDTYEFYSLSILVDLDGKVIAVNSRDSDGKPIRSAPIFQKNYHDAAWFQALVSSRFTTKMPFTAPGNDTATGTFIEDLHVDQDVKDAYPDNDGLTLAFSAPVYQGGKVIAYWSNRTKFSLVEDIVKSAYAELNAAGYPATELTMMDGAGRVIMNYDPSQAGTPNVRHDFNELMKFNMTEAGSLPAKAAVAGETGYGPSVHIRAHHADVRLCAPARRPGLSRHELVDSHSRAAGSGGRRRMDHSAQRAAQRACVLGQHPDGGVRHRSAHRAGSPSSHRSGGNDGRRPVRYPHRGEEPGRDRTTRERVQRDG